MGDLFSQFRVSTERHTNHIRSHWIQYIRPWTDWSIDGRICKSIETHKRAHPSTRMKFYTFLSFYAKIHREIMAWLKFADDGIKSRPLLAIHHINVTVDIVASSLYDSEKPSSGTTPSHHTACLSGITKLYMASIHIHIGNIALIHFVLEWCV